MPKPTVPDLTKRLSPEREAQIRAMADGTLPLGWLSGAAMNVLAELLNELDAERFHQSWWRTKAQVVSHRLEQYEKTAPVTS